MMWAWVYFTFIFYFFIFSEASLQCSVCWDDFKLDEEVRQLRCEHIFHGDCIIPWLELHDTCPVCRKEQGEETEETGTGNAEENSGGQESDAGSSTGGATSGGVSQQTRSGACPHSSSSASSATAGSGGHTPFTPSGSGGHTPFTQNSQTYQASSNVRNADNLMEAIGRYSSVFNTLLGYAFLKPTYLTNISSILCPSITIQ